NRVPPIRRSPMRRPTTRPKERPTGPCAYCGAPATTWDHVVPKSLARKLKDTLPLRLRDVVEACLDCNVRKMTRRLVPPSWADKVDELNERIGGSPFRVWRGGTDEPAFKEVHR